MPVEEDDVETTDVDAEFEGVRTPDASNGPIAKSRFDSGPTLVREC
jgi:hypothetical protein